MQNQNSPIVLLFKGHQVPDKQYIDLITKIPNSIKTYVINDTDNHYETYKDLVNHPNIIILSHSIGTIKAILYCFYYKLKPKIHISMDGTYLDPNVLIQTIHGSETDQVKKEYMELFSQLSFSNLILFRFIRNLGNESDGNNTSDASNTSDGNDQVKKELNDLNDLKENIKKLVYQNQLAITDSHQYPSIYKSVIFYTDSKAGHYTFRSKTLRNQIINLIQ